MIDAFAQSQQIKSIGQGVGRQQFQRALDGAQRFRIGIQVDQAISIAAIIHDSAEWFTAAIKVQRQLAADLGQPIGGQFFQDLPHAAMTVLQAIGRQIGV